MTKSDPDTTMYSYTHYKLYDIRVLYVAYYSGREKSPFPLYLLSTENGEPQEKFPFLLPSCNGGAGD